MPELDWSYWLQAWCYVLIAREAQCLTFELAKLIQGTVDAGNRSCSMSSSSKHYE